LKLPDEENARWREAKLGIFFRWRISSVLRRGTWELWNERILMREDRHSADQSQLTQLNAKA